MIARRGLEAMPRPFLQAKKKPMNSLPPMKQAQFAVPDGACDSHCHVFGPDSRFPVTPGMPYYPPSSPKEALFEMHDALGLSRGVIVQGATYGYDNAILLDAIAARPDRYRGIAVMDPQASDDEIARLDEGGVCGIRFSLLHGDSCQPDLWNDLARRIAPFGWHMEILLNPADLAEVGEVIRKLPVPVLLDHMARTSIAAGVTDPDFQTLLRLCGNENVWVKIANHEREAKPPYTDAVPMARALYEAAPDRVVWGSNFSHPNVRFQPVEAELLDLVPMFAGGEAGVRRVLVENPERLYGF